MLKIKDNVQLQELEKYGFEYFEGTTSKIYVIELGSNNDRVSVVVNCYNKHFWVTHEGCSRDISDELSDLVYDLIQAELIEKVEG